MARVSKKSLAFIYKPDLQKSRVRFGFMFIFFVYVWFLTYFLIVSNLTKSLTEDSLFFLTPFLFLSVCLYLDWVVVDMHRRGLEPEKFINYYSAQQSRAQVTAFYLRYPFIRRGYPIKYIIKINPVKVSDVARMIAILLFCSILVTAILFAINT